MSEAGAAVDFDARTAIDALELLANIAPEYAMDAKYLDAKESIVSTAEDILRTAKEWIALYVGPRKTFEGDPLLAALVSESRIEVTSFVEVLRKVSAELAEEEKRRALRLEESSEKASGAGQRAEGAPGRHK